MKKLFFIILFAGIVFSASIKAQQCVSCYENNVDFTANASAIGQHNTATGQASFAMGNESMALGASSGAFGINTEADAAAGFAIGRRIKSAATSSIVLGTGYNFTDYLINGTYNSLMIGFNSTAPTFFISESPSDASHKDRTGRIGIGNVTEPLTKLHLRADEGEEATAFIEPHNWDDGETAGIYLGNFQNGVFADNDNGMVYKTDNNHVFTGGDIYIRDIDKGIIMKSPDGKCWRGTLNNSGNLNFVQLDACPSDTTTMGTYQKTGSSAELKVYPNPASDYLTVELKNGTGKRLRVSLSDSKGDVFAIQYLRQGKTKFYVGNIPQGVYYVRVQGSGINMVKKVVRAKN